MGRPRARPAPGAPPSAEDVRVAARLLEGLARVTPVQRSETLTGLAGRPVFLKAENLQRTGSFKVRGAANRLATLEEPERRAGVVAASAGNHGQAVAFAASHAGVASTVFMPRDAALAKIEATRGYGADVRLEGGVLEETIEAARAFSDAHGAVFVHPFDDPAVIAGQGTLGLELAEQLPEAEAVVVPIGGGGLAAGVAIACADRAPAMRIVGVQAERCAPFAGASELGYTIADGIAVKQPGSLTRPIVEERVDPIVTVSDEDIARAIVLLLERAKLVVEGAGAASVAALLAGRVPGDGPVCCVLSGGNVDATVLVQVARYGLTQAGRYLVVRTRVPDRPGELAALLTRLAAESGANVVDVGHLREGVDVAVWETGIELTLLTRDEAHCRQIAEQMAGWGYPTERLR